MKNPIALAMAVATSLSSISTSYAVVLAQYDFEDAMNPQANIGTTPGVTAGDFTNGTGISSSTYNAGGLARAYGDQVSGTSGTPGTITSSIAGQDYFTFTIAPTSGNALNLTNLTLDAAYWGTNAPTVMANFTLRSELDMFANDIDSFSEVLVNDLTLTNHEISLSAPLYQGITTPVEFRIYLFDNNGSNRSIGVDNVILNGAVVPEPSSGLLLLGFMGILFSRRKRS